MMTNDSTRKRTHGRTTAIALAVIALIGAGYGVHVWRLSARRAAARSVAAALTRMESARGPLEVQCDQTSYGRFVGSVRYACNGDELRMEGSRRHYTQTGWYDLHAHEGQECFETTHGAFGSVTGRPGSPLTMSAMPDPIMRFIESRPLMEALKQGEVADYQETVDGHTCWRVLIPSREVSYDRFVVWVDPSIGFLPRRIAFVSDRRRSSFQSFSNYKQLRPGVWFPMRMSRWDAGGPETNVSTVTQVRSGDALPKDSLKIVFPSGTRVEDHIANRTYVVP